MNTGDVVDLQKGDLEIADAISRLFRSGHITIGVNIHPEYALKGSGQWNVTQAYAKVGDNYITLDNGTVEIIEGI